MANQIYETCKQEDAEAKGRLRSLTHHWRKCRTRTNFHQEEIERLRERLAVLIDRLQRGYERSCCFLHSYAEQVRDLLCRWKPIWITGRESFAQRVAE